MKQKIDILKKHIADLQIEELSNIEEIYTKYLKPLEEVSQESSHHKGETTLEHVFLVVHSLKNVLLFIKNMNAKKQKESTQITEIEALFETVNPEIYTRITAYINEKIDGITIETLIFYATLLHDTGKISILQEYETTFARFNRFSKHHLFGALIVNYYADCIKEIEECEKELKSVKERSTKEEKIKLVDEELKYLEYIKRFVQKNEEILQNISFTQKQFNFISTLIKYHHEFSGAFNEYKKNQKIQKNTKKIIKDFHNKGVLIGIILLFYADVMSCLTVSENDQVKKELVSFIITVLEITKE